MQTPAQLANLRPPYSKDNPPPGHTQKHPEGYLTCKLKKVLLKKYRCQDPETQKIKIIEGATGLMQVLVWEGMQGNVNATKEILDRIDGKLGQNGNGKGGNVAVVIHIGDKSGLLSPAEASRISSIRSEV